MLGSECKNFPKQSTSNVKSSHISVLLHSENTMLKIMLKEIVHKTKLRKVKKKKKSAVNLLSSFVYRFLRMPMDHDT